MNDFSHNNTKPQNDDTCCGRGQELIAYLYGENGVAADFTRHLSTCATCADEASSFRHARAEVTMFRESTPELKESFASLHYAALSFSNAEADSPAWSSEIAAPRSARSWHQARAALVEFFRVSPRWLQVSGVAAALALCALVLFSTVRTTDMLDAPQVTTERLHGVERPTAVSQTLALTQNELDQYVEREVARRTGEMQREQMAAAPTATPEGRTSDSSVASYRPTQRQTQTVQVRAGGKQRQPTSAAERQRMPQAPLDDLVADDDLPRLSDLLYGTD